MYIYGDILFRRISLNNFDAAIGSAIGLLLLLSEDNTGLFFIIGKSKTSINSLGKKVLPNILLNRHASTRKRKGDPSLYTSAGISSALTDLFYLGFRSVNRSPPWILAQNPPFQHLREILILNFQYN